MDFWTIILRILGLVGALGLFLFGIKIMSEALQRIAGHRARKVLSQITSSRFRGVLSGFLVTGIAQSSSAITVMIVTFVNAGLITLTKSVPIIMGANIGTTVTAWLVAFFGFTFDIQQFYLPIIGISLVLFLWNNNRTKAWGEFLMGLGILFIGLLFLKDGVPNFNQYPETLAFLSNYTNLGFFSVILFVFIGMIFTMIIQSSSASIALFQVLCYNGSISFELVAAMVLGANIGTTVTANLAAIVTNRTAKRSARVHSLFNIIGVVWFLILFNPIIRLTDLIVTNMTGYSLVNYRLSELSEIQVILPITVAAFHSFFNLINTVIQVNFVPNLVKLSSYLVSRKVGEKEAFSLRYISTRFSSTSEISIVQARKELALYAKQINQMFGYIPELLMEKEDSKYEGLLLKISRAEEDTDKMETEIANYLTRLAEDEVSLETSRKIRNMLSIASELEHIGDGCYAMAQTIKMKNEQKAWFTQEMRDNLFFMFNLIKKTLTLMTDHLENDPDRQSMQEMLSLKVQINEYRSRIHQEHLNEINEHKYSYTAGSYYNELISICKTVGEHATKVSESLIGKN
jgi:phosphate:Na+ symporter